MNSPISIDRSCIFRQEFTQGEQSVVNNPYAKGTFIGGLLQNGTAILSGNSQYIKYNLVKGNGDVTVRLRFKFNALPTSGTKVLLENRRTSTDTTATIWTSGTDPSPVYLNGLNGYTYVNGIIRAQNTFACSINTWYDTVISVTSKPIYQLLINNAYTLTQAGNVTVDLVEIYNRALTATEIALLYQGTLYKKPSFSESRDANINPDPTFATPASWAITTGWSVANNKATWNGTISASIGSNFNIMKPYHWYKISYDCTRYVNGSFQFGYEDPIYNHSGIGHYEHYVSHLNYTTFGIRAIGTGNFDIENLIVEPVYSLPTSLLFDLTAENGYIEERTGKALTITGNPIVKNSLIQMKYGDTIDTGSDWIGTKNITLSVWIRRGGTIGNYTFYIDNGKFFIYALPYLTKDDIYITSDASTNAIKSGANTNKGRFYHLVVIRNGTQSSLYINGVLSLAPTNSGTPINGTGNVKIYLLRTVQLGSIKGWEGVATPQQVAQLYNSEKYKYGY